MPYRFLGLALVCLFTSLAHGGVKFACTIDPKVRADAATGWLVVYLIRDGAHVTPMTAPADGFVEGDPQPMYGTDVKDVEPAAEMVVDDSATAFPVKLSDLPPGKYRVQ